MRADIVSSESDQSSDEQFRSYGRFDPLEAKRLLNLFEEAGIRFQIAPESIIRPMGAGTQLRRYDSVEILVHEEDDQKARRILREQLRLSN